MDKLVLMILLIGNGVGFLILQLEQVHRDANLRYRIPNMFAAVGLASDHSVTDSTTAPHLVILLPSTDDRRVDRLKELFWSGAHLGVRTTIVTSNAADARHRIGDMGADGGIVDTSVQDAADNLGLTFGKEDWALYDADGFRRAKGSLVRGGLRAALGQLSDGLEAFSGETLLAAMQSRDALGGFRQEKAHAASADSGRHVALFVGRATTSCPIADVLKLMDDAAIADPSTYFSVRVPSSWDDNRIEAMRRTFGLKVAIERVSSQVTAEWMRLADVYGTGATESFLALITPQDIESLHPRLSDIVIALGG